MSNNSEVKKETKKLRGVSPTREILRALKRNKLAIVGLVIILILDLIAIFAPWIAPYHPIDDNMTKGLRPLEPPSRKHLCGTDPLGRDVFSRIVYGARISMTIGFVSQGISLVIGLIMGSLAGYFGGKVDSIIMRIVEVMLAIPGFLFLIGIMVALGPGIYNVFLALGIVGWAGKARLVRGQVLQAKSEDYVMAAKAIGLSNFRIIFSHILPNCIAPVIVSVTLGIGGAIMAESTLSFLGLGVQPPQPSWGSMISMELAYLKTAPWLTIFPGIAILLAVLGFNLFGDGLQEAIDPQLRKK